MIAPVPATGLVDHAEFLRRLKARFPQVFDEIDDSDRGLLHLEMATLARATSAAISARESAHATDHFAFVDDLLAQADPSVENAIYVSYLENVFLGESRPEYLDARARLPNRLANALRELEQHFEELSRAAKGT